MKERADEAAQQRHANTQFSERVHVIPVYVKHSTLKDGSTVPCGLMAVSPHIDKTNRRLQAEMKTGHIYRRESSPHPGQSMLFTEHLNRLPPHHSSSRDMNLASCFLETRDSICHLSDTRAFFLQIGCFYLVASAVLLMWLSKELQH